MSAKFSFRFLSELLPASHSHLLEYELSWLYPGSAVEDDTVVFFWNAMAQRRCQQTEFRGLRGEVRDPSYVQSFIAKLLQISETGRDLEYPQ